MYTSKYFSLPRANITLGKKSHRRSENLSISLRQENIVEQVASSALAVPLAANKLLRRTPTSTVNKDTQEAEPHENEPHKKQNHTRMNHTPETHENESHTRNTREWTTHQSHPKHETQGHLKHKNQTRHQKNLES